jgi:hypothetical protein
MRNATGRAFRAWLPILLCVLGVFLSGSTHRAIAQLRSLADTDWTDWVGPAGAPQLRARLKAKAQNAAQQVAVVEVEVRNAFLDNPNVIAQTGVESGILQYQVDQCPTIVTTDSQLQFQGLAPGSHLITVVLIGRDNRLLTPRVNLQVTIP